LTDVIEVVLAHGDDALKGLAEAWSASADETTGDDADSIAARAAAVSTAEVEAVRQSMARLGDPRRITNRCSRPERAARALTWLTQDAVQVTFADTPGLPMLGPVLRVRSGDAVFPVPASLTLDALNAAADILLRRPEIGGTDAVRLQALTCGHAFAVFNKRSVNRSAPLEIDLGTPPIIVGPRTVATVVSALNPGMFTEAIEHATDLLCRRQVEPDTWHVMGDQPAPATASLRVDHLVKVVVYGGPLVINLRVPLHRCLAQVSFLVGYRSPASARPAAGPRASPVRSARRPWHDTQLRGVLPREKILADHFYRGLHPDIEHCPLWTVGPCQPIPTPTLGEITSLKSERNAKVQQGTDSSYVRNCHGISLQGHRRVRTHCQEIREASCRSPRSAWV
jgi:hypothetical protein